MAAAQHEPSADTRRILAAQEWCQDALLQRLSRFGDDNDALVKDLRLLRIGEQAISRFEAVLRMQERIHGVDLDRILELPAYPQLQLFSGHQSINGQPVLVLTSGWVDPAQLRRFHRECAMLKEMPQPNLATLLSSGETRGVCWATFDAPTGYPLQHRLFEAPLPEAEALWLMRQFVSGLATQRHLGIGSRYATPHALWIVRDDSPLPSAYVVDLGIMRNLIGSKRQTGVDPVDYLAPEQVRGGQPDELSLVYHCGAMLYHALVGSPPFVESDPELVRKAHLFEEVPALHRLFPDLDPATCELVAVALSKDPQDRCAGLAEFQVSLERVLERKGLLLAAPEADEVDGAADADANRAGYDAPLADVPASDDAAEDRSADAAQEEDEERQDGDEETAAPAYAVEGGSVESEAEGSCADDGNGVALGYDEVVPGRDEEVFPAEPEDPVAAAIEETAEVDLMAEDAEGALDEDGGITLEEDGLMPGLDSEDGQAWLEAEADERVRPVAITADYSLSGDQDGETDLAGDDGREPGAKDGHEWEPERAADDEAPIGADAASPLAVEEPEVASAAADAPEASSADAIAASSDAEAAPVSARGDTDSLPEYTIAEVRTVPAADDEIVAPFSGADEDPFAIADRQAIQDEPETEADPVAELTSRILAKHKAMKATGRIRPLTHAVLAGSVSPLQVPPTSAEKLLAVVAANHWLDAAQLLELSALCRSHASSSAGLLPRDIIARLHGSRLLGMEQVVELRATLIDQAMFPRYHLGRQLGVGSMGRTYAAIDTLGGEQVVCKIFKSSNAVAEQVRSDWDAVVPLRHPRLVAAIACEAAPAGAGGAGRESGFNCAVSRQIVGVSLRTVLGGDLPAPEAWSLRVIQQVTEGLGHLHERTGQLHLGLGLGNIILQRRELESRMFLPGEQSVISDIGFSALRAERTSDLPWYAAPELQEGVAASQRSDIWSLGALLTRMLTGEPPLAGGRRRAVLSSGLHPLTTTLIGRALAEPSDRYADLSEFTAALSEVAGLLGERGSGSRYQTVGPRVTPRPEGPASLRPQR